MQGCFEASLIFKILFVKIGKFIHFNNFLKLRNNRGICEVADGGFDGRGWGPMRERREHGRDT